MSDPLAFDTATPRLALPLLFAGQSQKEFTVNEALLRTDLVLQCAVEGELAAPPPTPLEGQVWLVAANPTGLFAGHGAAIAGFTGGGWVHRGATGDAGVLQFRRMFSRFHRYLAALRYPTIAGRWRSDRSGGANCDR